MRSFEKTCPNEVLVRIFKSSTLEDFGSSPSFRLVKLHVIEASGPMISDMSTPPIRCQHMVAQEIQKPLPFALSLCVYSTCCWAEYQATVLFVFINQVQNHCGLWIIYISTVLTCTDILYRYLYVKLGPRGHTVTISPNQLSCCFIHC